MKTRLHVPVPEEPCTPRKLLQARKILQLQRGTTQGREWQAPRSVSQSLKTALAESWKTKQIRTWGSRWDHERKGHWLHLQWLIFKLYTRKHLAYISLVAPIIYYLGHREYLEIPLRVSPTVLSYLFLLGFLSSFLHPVLLPSLWQGTAAAPFLPSPSPCLLSAISFGFFSSCIHQSWIQWQPLGNFPLLVTQVIRSGALGSCQAWCHGSAEKIPYVIARYTS